MVACAEIAGAERGAQKTLSRRAAGNENRGYRLTARNVRAEIFPVRI